MPPLADIIGWAAGLVVAGGGIYIAIHETRRRERRTTRAELRELTDEVDALRHLLLQQRRWIYQAATLLIDHGIEVPPPPDPSFDPGEYDVT